MDKDDWIWMGVIIIIAVFVIGFAVHLINTNDTQSMYEREYFGKCRSLGYDDARLTWKISITDIHNFTVECINYIRIDKVNK